MAQKKTNAMRLLDKLGIEYQVFEYFDSGEHILPKGAASRTAQKLHILEEQVFKTLVMQDEKKKIYVFCQNATCQINLKKARQITGAKSIALVNQNDLLSLTGYIRGGCSPLAMKKQFPIFIDSSALKCQTIYISAGTRGMQLALCPKDLQKATNATFCEL